MHQLLDRIHGPLPDLAAVEIDPRHPRLSGEGDEGRFVRGELATANPVLLLRQDDDRPPLGRLVGDGRQLRRVRERGVADSRGGPEISGLAVAERNRPRLVEQQRVHVTCGFHRPARHGEHVVLHEAIHPRDADRGDQRANRRRNQADQQRNQHRNGNRRARIQRKRLERDHDQEEHEREHGQQDGQRDLVRRLLADGPLDQRDHAIEERLAGIRRDPHANPVGQHPCAPGDGGTVATGFADDGRGLTGDRRLVHARDALDDLAVAGDQLAGLDQHEVACAERAARYRLTSAVGSAAERRSSRPSPSAAWPPAPCRVPRPSLPRSWRRRR